MRAHPCDLFIRHVLFGDIDCRASRVRRLFEAGTCFRRVTVGLAESCLVLDTAPGRVDLNLPREPSRMVFAAEDYEKVPCPWTTIPELLLEPPIHLYVFCGWKRYQKFLLLEAFQVFLVHTGQTEPVGRTVLTLHGGGRTDEV